MKKLSIDDLMAEIWAAGRNCDREKYDNATDELSSRFIELENLKCCGNCRKYTATRRCYIIHPGSHCCEFWYPDGLKRKERA
ncbi:MAG TPA: hypothetical protein ACFYEK_04575 [Candidatus Wunengus sp. YC60]|jgi:hypothetical protein|uniref:hypothetical protein n=1 Tax=Candidatus Wunengus sp. YC60 TaxID=3367697 RepID=UPI0040264874